MARFRCARRCNLRLPDRVGLAAMHFPCTPQNESLLTEKKRQGKSSFPLALQTVKKHLGGVGGAAAPLTFIRIRRLCRRGGLLILPAKSIPYKFGRPLVGRICFLAKVVKPLLRHAETAMEIYFPSRLFSLIPQSPASCSPAPGLLGGPPPGQRRLRCRPFHPAYG